jgi:hypothetical protein
MTRVNLTPAPSLVDCPRTVPITCRNPLPESVNGSLQTAVNNQLCVLDGRLRQGPRLGVAPRRRATRAENCHKKGRTLLLALPARLDQIVPAASPKATVANGVDPKTRNDGGV